MPTPLPAELNANAWCGTEAAHGPFHAKSLGWGAHQNLWKPAKMLAPAAPPNLADWTDPNVGWGLIVPDREEVPGADKARGLDLPDSLLSLVTRRSNAPIFRYRADLPEGLIRRYSMAGAPSDPSLRGKRGMALDAVPHYLLIVGDPVQIPWSFQYRLQTEAFVGRLDLDEPGLGRYVQALLGDWGNCNKVRSQPVVWAVDHGHPDITHLMRKTIAELLVDSFTKDPDFKMGGGFHTDAQATQAGLIEALGERNPAFVMTSSHGATFPLDDPPVMRGQLGLPMDQAHTAMNLGALSAWNPYGTIWYAHACCSAGGDGKSRFAGLVEEGSSLGRTLEGIAMTGACQAPLPRALLGGPHPARAFIGHVEPTFDWTLRDPVTGHVTTSPLVDVFYQQLHQTTSPPIGFAMRGFFQAVAGLLLDYSIAIEGINTFKNGAPQDALRAKLTALDRLAMVILGDPTVRLTR